MVTLRLAHNRWPRVVRETLPFPHCSAPEFNNRRFKASAFRCSLIETCACCHDDAWTGVAFDLQKQRQPFGCDFRIRQYIFDPAQLCFREKKRIWLPVEQAFVENFLGMNAGAEDPNRGICSLLFTEPTSVIGIGENCSQKRLRRLDHMRKLYRPFSSLYRLELARD